MVITLLVKITNNTLILVKDDVIDLENFAIKIRAYAFFFLIYIRTVYYTIVVKYIKSEHILIPECCCRSNFDGSRVVVFLERVHTLTNNTTYQR